MTHARLSVSLYCSSALSASDAMSGTVRPISTPFFPPFPLAVASISATDAGSFLLSVSGSQRANSPAVVEKTPKMMAGMPGWTCR